MGEREEILRLKAVIASNNAIIDGLKGTLAAQQRKELYDRRHDVTINTHAYDWLIRDTCRYFRKGRCMKNAQSCGYVHAFVSPIVLMDDIYVALMLGHMEMSDFFNQLLVKASDNNWRSLPRIRSAIARILSSFL